MLLKGKVSSADNIARIAEVWFPELDAGVTAKIPIVASVPDLTAGDIVYVGLIGDSLIDAVILAKPGSLIGKALFIYDDLISFPAEGESGKLYLAENSSRLYYWTGIAFSEIHFNLDKADVGLGNVDNTSDIAKPISNAVATALSAKADLDASGHVPAAQLPSYVDDILEYTSVAAFPVIGESGKIYVVTDGVDANKEFRWAGTQYVEVAKSLALGSTPSTAFPGNYGQAAYDHSLATGNPHGLTLSALGGVPTVRKVNGQALSADIILTLASADFANQGSVNTVLHGNAAGNPSFSAIVKADILVGAARKVLGRTSAGAGAAEELSLLGNALAILTAAAAGASGNLLAFDPNGTVVDALLAASAAPKLVNRQNDTSNVAVSNQLIQTGWGWKLGTGASFMYEAVTFPVPFDDVPIIVMSNPGTKSGADPTALGDFIATNGDIVDYNSPTTNGFNALMATRDNSNQATTVRYGYSWVAIGTKART